MDVIAGRIRELRQESGKTQEEFARIAGVSLRTQSNYESGKRSPDTAYLEALREASYDVQYVLTGFRAREVPGAREFMDRMEEAAGKMRALWRAYPLPEDQGLFAAMQGARAVPGVTDGHMASLAQAFTALLKQKQAKGRTSKTAKSVTPAEDASARSVHPIDEPLLLDAIAAVEQYRRTEHRKMSDDEIAKLVIKVYVRFSKPEQPKASRENVLKFIRRAA